MLFLQSRFEYEVRRHSRTMNLRMAEKYLAQFETSCMQRNFCSIGAVTDKKFEKIRDNNEMEIARYSIMSVYVLLL